MSNQLIIIDARDVVALELFEGINSIRIHLSTGQIIQGALNSDISFLNDTENLCKIIKNYTDEKSIKYKKS